jgi:hypothetical protein
MRSCCCARSASTCCVICLCSCTACIIFAVETLGCTREPGADVAQLCGNRGTLSDALEAWQFPTA